MVSAKYFQNVLIVNEKSDMYGKGLTEDIRNVPLRNQSASYKTTNKP